LSDPGARREIHERTIAMKVFARDDGLYDIEAHLIDRKPFPFWREHRDEPIAPGQPLHNFWIRLTVDKTYLVHRVEASSETTPFDLCKEAEQTLAALVGERIASGWSSKVKGALRGAASCTHLMELLLTLATPAVQGIRGLMREQKVVSDEKSVTGKLDTCYAYSRERAVVKMYWPQHYRAPEKV
jgi:hypothetical protein